MKARFVLSGFADEAAPGLADQLATLEMLGIGYIELRNVAGRCVIEYSLAEAREFKKTLDARGIRVSAIGSPLGKQSILEDFEPHFRLFLHTLEMAAILETRYIRMFSFYLPPGDDPAAHRGEVLRRWERFAAAAKGRGLILAHENERGIYGDTPDRCRDLLDALACDHVRAVLDPANYILCGAETYPRAYGLLRGRIAYLHIKDAVRGDGRIVPAGQGDGRVGDLLAALRDDDFSGFLTLEPHLGSFAGAAALERDAGLRDLPEGGPRQFALATKALRALLHGIGVEEAKQF
ncbi:MAG: sugar phosphate isomerase/epimerase family protein [Patescibacteria group bacterium]